MVVLPDGGLSVVWCPAGGSGERVGQRSFMLGLRRSLQALVLWTTARARRNLKPALWCISRTERGLGSRIGRLWTPSSSGRGGGQAFELFARGDEDERCWKGGCNNKDKKQGRKPLSRGPASPSTVRARRPEAHLALARFSVNPWPSMEMLFLYHSLGTVLALIHLAGFDDDSRWSVVAVNAAQKAVHERIVLPGQIASYERGVVLATRASRTCGCPARGWVFGRAPVGKRCSSARAMQMT